MVLAVLPMVELVEVAEGVLEPLDHLGTHPDRFLFKNRSFLAKDNLLVLHLEVKSKKLPIKSLTSRLGLWLVACKVSFIDLA